MNRNRMTMTLLAAMIAAAFGSAQAAEVPAQPASGASPSTRSAPSAQDAQTDPSASSDQDQTQDSTSQSKKKNAKSSSEQPVTLSTVTVNSLRASLESAQNIKRNARMVVDSVVA